ncbi:MAG: type VI secretion system baseplate subunit TssG [Aquabacterium sp.]
MPTPQRRDAIGVIDRLLHEPQQFDFFQAVRLLDRWMGAGVPDGQGLSKLNFRNSLSMSFAPSAIEALTVHREGHEVARIDMTPAFMGMLGVNGTLPLFYTEMLAQRELYQKDQSGRAFMDMFSHRAVSLFYEAWRKHRMPIQFEAGRRSRFLPLALSLAGLGQKGLRDRLGAGEGVVADESLAFYAGALQQRTLSARQLQQILQDYLTVPVRIEQFVGRWYQLPESALFLGARGQGAKARGGLGLGKGVLGRSAMLGERVWQRDLRMRVVLGPLNHGKFRRFLPGEAGAQALKALLTMLSGVSLEYEVNLRLQRGDVQGARLDSGRPATAFRLGWDTFLQTQPANEDRADVRYDIHAAA